MQQRQRRQVDLGLAGDGYGRVLVTNVPPATADTDMLLPPTIDDAALSRAHATGR
jgi:hypothetical protein